MVHESNHSRRAGCSAAFLRGLAARTRADYLAVGDCSIGRDIAVVVLFIDPRMAISPASASLGRSDIVGEHDRNGPVLVIIRTYVAA